MKNSPITLRNSFLILALLMFVSAPSPVFAGAIAGDEGESSCDRRRLMSEDSNLGFCVSSERTRIGESCYIVVHSVPLSGRKCSWQGCGYLSLVGKPAKLTDMSSKFEEYGSKFPRNNASFAGASDGSGVLPKYPYPRHYLTVKEAQQALSGCPGNPLSLPESVRAAICNAETNMLRLNPYWHCYISKD